MRALERKVRTERMRKCGCAASGSKVDAYHGWEKGRGRDTNQETATFSLLTWRVLLKRRARDGKRIYTGTKGFLWRGLVYGGGRLNWGQPWMDRNERQCLMLVAFFPWVFVAGSDAVFYSLALKMADSFWGHVHSFVYCFRMDRFFSLPCKIHQQIINGKDFWVFFSLKN